MTAMTSQYCEKIKHGDTDAEDFAAFLHHIGSCKDCIRRIFSRIVIEFQQRENGDK